MRQQSVATRPRKLLDQVRDALRLKHCSVHTEEAYVNWIRRYILFHSKRHPLDMGTAEIKTFLTHLAVEVNVVCQSTKHLVWVLSLTQVCRQAALSGPTCLFQRAV